MSAPSGSSSKRQRWRMLPEFFTRTTIAHSTDDCSSVRRVPRLTIRQASIDESSLHKCHAPVVIEEDASQSLTIADEFASRTSSMDSGCQQQPPNSAKQGKRFAWFSRQRSSNASSSTDSAWRSGESALGGVYTWRAADGLFIVLQGTRIEYLSEVERSALHKIAVQRLQQAKLQVSIVKPKEGLHLKTVTKARKKQPKEYRRSNTVTCHSTGSNSGSGGTAQVFGIPISMCVANEAVTSPTGNIRCRSLDLAPHDPIEPQTSHGLLDVPIRSSAQRQTSISSACSDSVVGVPIGTRSAGYRHQSTGSQSQSIDYPQNMPSSSYDSAKASFFVCSSPSGSEHSPQFAFMPHQSQVPKVVENCTEYLTKHVKTEGLFRKSGSKARCEQLRTELDNGVSVVIMENESGTDLQPHDVATLLKQYFKELPHALLTEEMYPIFVAIGCRLRDTFTRIELLRYVTSLLPIANSDTLLVLLKFLRQVSRHSGVALDKGNLMDVHNLAVVFGPNILRLGYGDEKLDLANNEAIISVIETLIEHVDDIFLIPKELQNELLQQLRVDDGVALDKVLYALHSQITLVDGATEDIVTFGREEATFAQNVSLDADGSTVLSYKTELTQRVTYRPSQHRLQRHRQVMTSTEEERRKCSSVGELHALTIDATLHDDEHAERCVLSSAPPIRRRSATFDEIPTTMVTATASGGQSPSPRQKRSIFTRIGTALRPFSKS